MQVKDDFQSVLCSLSTLMFINFGSLTQWNANQCCSLRTTHLIFEAFQLFSLQLHWLNFTAVYVVVSSSDMRKNEAQNLDQVASIMTVVLKLWIYFIYICDVLHETKQKMQTNSGECTVQTGNHLLIGILILSIGIYTGLHVHLILGAQKTFPSIITTTTFLYFRPSSDQFVKLCCATRLCHSRDSAAVPKKIPKFYSMYFF